MDRNQPARPLLPGSLAGPVQAPGPPMIAANRAGHKEWDEKGFSQLVQIGGDSHAFHLFMGKVHLNLEQCDLALADFQVAAQANLKLPNERRAVREEELERATVPSPELMQEPQ